MFFVLGEAFEVEAAEVAGDGNRVSEEVDIPFDSFGEGIDLGTLNEFVAALIGTGADESVFVRLRAQFFDPSPASIPL